MLIIYESEMGIEYTRYKIMNVRAGGSAVFGWIRGHWMQPLGSLACLVTSPRHSGICIKLERYELSFKPHEFYAIEPYSR